MTRILFVIENLYFGGGERGFAQIINNLDKDKYEIHIACLPGGEFEEKVKGKAMLHPVSLRKGVILQPAFCLADIMKKSRIQIVHSQGARADFFSRIAVKGTKGVRLVSATQMPVEGYDIGLFKKLVYVILDRLTEGCVDKFIVVSEALKAHFIKKHRILPDKIIKIYNGVEIDSDLESPATRIANRKRLLQEFKIAEDSVLVGTAARLVWQKGLIYFLQAIRHIKEGKRSLADKVKYLIIGEGKLRTNLENLAKSFGIEGRVIFTGFRSDIKEILPALDIFVLPSILEGQPIIILEAMACAKAIVATDIAGVNETIDDNSTGMLVPAKNAQALAKAIIYLLSDDTKARAMGQKAREAVRQKFSVEQMMRLTEGVYQQLAKE